MLVGFDKVKRIKHITINPRDTTIGNRHATINII